ncbi:hypothetical protein JCM8097_001000 [Rhodosporidiobolus ruineniae]
MSAANLTIWSARICPWAQRATLVLREAGAYENGLHHEEIDLQNKPADYAQRVNPASKVPVLQVGKEGEPDTAFIPESAVVLELVAELFPDSGLSPKDPVDRAKARYFISRFHEVATSPFLHVVYQGKLEAADAALAGIEEVQQLLAKQPGKFLLGDQPTIGDLGVAPFVGRLFAFSKAGIVPESIATPLLNDPKYEAFRAYHEAITSRPSWKATFDDEYIVSASKERIEKLRAQQ